MNHSYIKILGVAQRKSFGKSCYFLSVQFISVTQLCQALCDSMDCSTPGLPVPSPTPRAYPNSCPLSWWCHPTISSSVIPFSSCSQSFPASESFQMSQPFVTGGQSIGVSASTSVLPMNTQGIKEYAGPDREKRNILKKRSKIRQWQELGEESWKKTLKVFDWLRGLEHIQ